MIKYIFSKNDCVVKFDTETSDINVIEYEYQSIRRVTMLDEDGEATIGDKVYNVKKGDIVVSFYKNNDTDIDHVVLKNKDWKKRIIQMHEAEQKRKEEWAKKQKDGDAVCPEGCDCECVCKGC